MKLKKDKYLVRICEYLDSTSDYTFFIKRKRNTLFSFWDKIVVYYWQSDSVKKLIRFESYEKALIFCDEYDVYNTEKIILENGNYTINTDKICNSVCRGKL